MSENPVYIKAESPDQYEAHAFLQRLLDGKREFDADETRGWKKAYCFHSLTLEGLTFDVEDENLADAEKELFLGILKKMGLEVRLIHQSKSTRASSLSLVAENQKYVTLIDSAKHYVSFRTWSTSVEEAALLNKKMEELLPGESPDPESVPFHFWRLTANNQPFSIEKDLICPRWEDIKGNYSEEVVKQFEKLLNLENAFEYGKIIIWNGPPGNGKTYLIRALSREWAIKHQVEPEILIDPESFFQQSFYLDSLLTSEVASANEPTFRLVIIEDFAHIISTGCRQHPGFARLLNATDGLIGQGQKIIFLLTTNEQLDVIDPAILRPGRCLQRLEIKPMSKERGMDWLKKKGVEEADLTGKDEVSLADLYAILHGNPFENETEDGKFGF